MNKYGIAFCQIVEVLNSVYESLDSEILRKQLEKNIKDIFELIDVYETLNEVCSFSLIQKEKKLAIFCDVPLITLNKEQYRTLKKVMDEICY